jgi:hypothetical protein
MVQSPLTAASTLTPDSLVHRAVPRCRAIGVKRLFIRGKLPDIYPGAEDQAWGGEPGHILKAELAVVTTRYTRQEYALFGQALAGRNWLFLLPWQVEMMSLAMDGC